MLLVPKSFWFGSAVNQVQIRWIWAGLAVLVSSKSKTTPTIQIFQIFLENFIPQKWKLISNYSYLFSDLQPMWMIWLQVRISIIWGWPEPPSLIKQYFRGPTNEARGHGGQYVLQSFFQLLRLQVSFSSLLLIKRTCCTMFNMTENSFFSLKKNWVGKICITREKWSIVMKAAKSQKMLSICSHFQKTQMSVIFPTSSFLWNFW